MKGRESGVSFQKNECITDLTRAVETGSIHAQASLMLEAGHDRLNYIAGLSQELSRLARQLDEQLLAYFFDMAAYEARAAQARLDSH